MRDSKLLSLLDDVCPSMPKKDLAECVGFLSVRVLNQTRKPTVPAKKGTQAFCVLCLLH